MSTEQCLHVKEEEEKDIWSTARNITRGPFGTQKRIHMLELGHAPLPDSCVQLSDHGTHARAPKGKRSVHASAIPFKS